MNINCSNNELTEDAIEQFFEDLPNVDFEDQCQIHCYGNIYSDDSLTRPI